MLVGLNYKRNEFTQDVVVENNEWIERIRLAEEADSAVEQIFEIPDSVLQTIQEECGFLPGDTLVATGELEQQLIARSTAKSERRWDISRDFPEKDEANSIKRLLLLILHSKSLYFTTSKNYLAMLGRSINTFRQTKGIVEGQLARHVISSACRGATLVQELMPTKSIPFDWSEAIRALRKLDEIPFKEGEYQPIPDDLLIDLAHRFIFFGEKVMPRLTTMLKLVRDDMYSEGCRPGVHSDEQFKILRLSTLQKIGASGKLSWVDDTKNQLAPDFQINFSEKRWTESFDGLPNPEQITWQQIVDIYNLCKCAPWFYIKLVTGSRSTESNSILRNCLSTDFGQMSIQGKTYKLEKDKGGASRDWPLPERVGHILENFIELDGVTRNLVNWEDTLGDEIFRTSIFFRKSEFWWSANAMKSAMIKFGLDMNYPGEVVHDHRFRKTIGRVLAIASERGAELALQLFGHKDMAMTLHYMTTDPDLLDAIIHAREECRKALGLEIVQNLDKFEGQAVERIKDNIEILSKSVVGGMFAGQRESTDSAIKLSEILFDKGDLPRFVNGGTICTKPRKGIPKCGNTGGDPNTLNCQTGCEHRVIRLDELNNTRAILDRLFTEYQSVSKLKGKRMKYDLHEISRQIRSQVGEMPEVIAHCSDEEKKLLAGIGVDCG